MNMRHIGKRRNHRGARVALSALLTISMLLGSVPNGALKAMAEELEQVPVEEVVPESGEQAADGAAVAGETPDEDAGGEAAADQGEEPQDGTAAADDQDSEQDPAVDQADVIAPLAAPAPGGLLGNPMPGPSGDGLVHAWADPDTRTTVDTNALGFTINLFNYDAVDTKPITNQYNNDHTDGSPGTNGNGTNSGINYGKSKANQLKFYETGDGNTTQANRYTSSDPSFRNPNNGINQFTGVGNTGSGDNFYTLQFANQGIVKAVLSGSDSDDPATRFPVLNTNASDKSTNYLFDTTPSAAKAVYSGVNNLFYLENQGAANERLVYDSNDSYAYYDVSQRDGGDFVIYDGTYDRAGGSKSGMKVGFFPFNQFAAPGATPCINPNENAWVNGAMDHHLGLTLNVPFTMPYNGDIHRSSGQDVPMVFEFSGDDDMWVFVDGKLVLDIGGIHQPVRGTINFETGVIQLSSGTANPPVDGSNNPVTQGGYSYAAIGIDDANNPGYQLTRGDTVYLYTENDHEGILGPRDSAANRAGTTHTLQAFYLERGGCDSNLEISTNIHLMTKKKVNVEKEWHPSVPDFNKTSSVEVELIRKAVGRDVTSHVECAVVSTATLDETGEWKASWSDLPSEGYNASGVYDEAAGATNTYCDYSYYVREVPVHGCYPEYSNSTSIAAEEITYTDTGGDQKTAPAAAVGDNYEPMLITNMPQKTKVAVEKVWTDSATNDHSSDSIWVRLYKTVDSTTTPVGSPVELKRDTADATKSWKHVFEDLDVLPAGGTYTVAEGKVESGSFVSYGTDPFQLNGKTYKQKSLVYTDADGAPVNELDGTVKDNAGKAVITNEPIQANIIIKKVDAKDRTVNIPGATFKVYKDDGVTPVAYSAATDNVPAFANETASTFTTGTDGTIRVDGLIPGVYWLVETDTADGYLVRDPNHPIQVLVDANGQANYVEDTAYETNLSRPSLPAAKEDGAQTLTVPNVPVYALPSAGGTGAYPFLAAGAFVAAMALTSDDVKRRLMGLLGMGARR